MERNFSNRDFEQFVKQNADQYRMFPSENVWTEIHNTLHSRRRWYGIGLALLLLTSGAVTWVMLSSTNKNLQDPGFALTSNIQSPSSLTEKKAVEPNLLSANQVRSTNNNRNVPFNTGSVNADADPFISGNFSPEFNGEENKDENIAGTGNVMSNTVAFINAEKEIINPANPSTASASRTSSPAKLVNARNTKPAAVIAADKNNLKVSFARNENNSELIDLAIKKAGTEEKIINKPVIETDFYPLTIESVLNTFKRNARKKLSWQVYFAPTISYRILKENKDFVREAQARNNPYGFSSLYDINNVVTHKPDMGLEIGLTSAYSVSKRINLTAGFQVNVSKYDIKASTYPTEIAIIALEDNFGTTSVLANSNYRNYNGSKGNWLHNLYVSASLPIGAQLKIAGNSRINFGIGGTVQPTFVIRNKAYLLSTDYKNYAEIPSLMRPFNLSTGLETYVGFKAAGVKWKVGPQMRYQWLSSFEKEYPVKEYLFDFGLKLGIVLDK